MMGSDLSTYRAAIGIFNNRRFVKSGPLKPSKSTFFELLCINLKCTFLVVNLSILQSVNPNIDIVFLLFVLHFILIIGNIEMNPGPGSSTRSSVTDNSLSICNINIRSIRNKLNFLNLFCEDFDIIAITETHLDPNIKDEEIHLESFSKSIHRKDRNAFGGGILILTKENIHVKRMNMLENDVDETIWVEISAKGQKFLLCNVYRPPGTDSEFYTRLNHSIGTSYLYSHGLVICGDLNTDLLVRENNRLLDTMNLFNLTNVIKKATRVTDQRRSLLDPILISDTLSYSFSDVFDVPRSISDHDAAVVYLLCPHKESVAFKRHIWLYDKTNKEKFSADLQALDWNALLPDGTDVDQMTDIFTETFLAVAGRSIPTREVTIRRNDKSWFNNELRREIRKRDRLRKRALKSKTDDDILKYKRQRNRVNNLKKSAKEKFESNLDNFILENVNNPKAYWKIMKMLIKSNKGSNSIPPLQNIINDQDLNDIAYADDEKCALLNKYFCSITKLDEENHQVPEFQNRTNHKLSDVHIEESEIIDIIKVLKPNKASGPDVISHKMLQLCPDKIALPLQKIFNKSIQQCKFPTSWKLANVTALFKKGDTSLPSNYRPISLISCVGKVMERIIFKYVYNHLHSNNLIYKYQSGFLPKHSTVHQLLEIYSNILNSLEKKEINCFVFCDFSKAFDKVWHKGLMCKLDSYGISGNLVNWFKSYLLDRRQKVILNTSSSNSCSLSAGVPQGSVLGPLLFIIYINDIAGNLTSLCRLYADDTSFSYSDSDREQIFSVISHDLVELDKWSNKWLMSFNPDKTEIMVFSNIEKPDFNFSLNGTSVPITDCHKHLGVTFSSNAKWNDHIENVVTSVKKHLNILRKLKYQLNRNTLEKLYLVYIRPILEYAPEVWDNCGVCLSSKLERLQLEAARIVTGLPIFTNSEKLYGETGWEKLEVRRNRRKLNMMYNIEHKNAPAYLCDLIPPKIQSLTNYPLRNGNDIMQPFCRLSVTSESFFPSTIKEWNKLDICTRELDSISKFKPAFKSNTNILQVPKHFSFGPRKLNIILTQLRHSVSSLKHDLHRMNIVDAPFCRCGRMEDVNHFFFHCPLYDEIRARLLNHINWIPDTLTIDVELLTRGSLELTYDQNISLLKHVLAFIKDSERFSVV